MPSLTPQETLTYHALRSLIRAILPANIDLRANIYNRFDINLVFVFASFRGRNHIHNDWHGSSLTQSAPIM